MSEETKTTNNTDVESANNLTEVLTNYKQQMADLQRQLETVQSQNAELVSNFLNNNEPETEPEPEPTVVKSKELLAKEFSDLMSTKPTNLDFCKKALELDDAAIARGDESVFLPFGRQVEVTENERSIARRVHDAFKTALDNSNGDPRAFDHEIERLCPGRFPDRTRSTK